ncbi:MAG: GldG family protein [Defluviitaleaceae bacterium]|nr:GldG family protein [Defluviitaleaceae bacterium]
MNFTRLFKDKRFRYGTLSTVMMIFAVVIFVLVSIVAEEFNESWDLTAEEIYTLTPQTERFLENLEIDVTLYYIARTGAETHLITRLFAEYAAASPRITTEIRDPMINPTFVHQFATGADAGIMEGSVVVRSEQGFRVISPMEMETWTRHPQTWQPIRESIDAERAITQAINSLTMGDPPVVYYIVGSGEPPLSEAFVEFMAAENFVIREHNALLHDIPETADALIITMPERDWGSAKADRILDYLDNNEGRAFIALNVMTDYFPELSRVLNSYGVGLGDYVIIEGDNRRTLGGTPTWMLPIPVPHEQITEPLHLENFVQFVLSPTGLEILPMRRTSTVIEPLLITSRDAYGRRMDTDAETILRVPEDEEGPFLLAAAITDTVFLQTTHTTRLVVVSSWTIMDDFVNTTIGGGNWAFVASSLNWLRDQPPGIWVPVRRPPGGTPVMLSDAQVFAMSGIAMGVIPVTLFGIGIFVWFRRRHS